uniref:Uncharacterized protein n=1 Tax=Arundo donax TaxID=35708 RepID=A0A0A9C3K4_ARUDO
MQISRLRIFTKSHNIFYMFCSAPGHEHCFHVAHICIPCNVVRDHVVKTQGNPSDQQQQILLYSTRAFF